MSWQQSIIHAASFAPPFRNLWPLFVAPAAASLISDRTARLVPQTPAGAWPAAALAAIPGLVGIAVIWQAINIGTVLTWRGAVIHWLTPPVAAALVAYAMFRAVQRQREVARLFASARPASGVLACASRQLGLRVREIPNDTRDCFVAGVLRPTVFVSTGALAQLGEEELRAALCHERAHAKAFDTLSLTLLALLRDFAPWGRGVALDAFRAAREAAADRAAAHSAGSINLAAALLILARPGSGVSGAAVLPMARGDSLRRRMQALLDGEWAQNPGWTDWAGVFAGVVLSAAFLSWPVVQLHVISHFCFDH